MFDFIPGKKVLDVLMPDDEGPDGKGTDKPGLVDKARAGWRAVKEAWSKDGTWGEKLAVLTETYSKELAEIQKKKDGVTAETEDELDKAADETEGGVGEFEKAIIPRDKDGEHIKYEAPELSDTENKKKDDEAFATLEAAIAKNLGDKGKEVDDPDLKAALEKMKNQTNTVPEDGRNALDAKQAKAFSAATINTWLDLTYDENGNRISPDEFQDLVHRLWKQSPRAKGLVETFFKKNFQYAFTAMEQGAKLDVMSEFGVEAGFSDLMGAGKASKIRDALVVVGTKVNGGSDRGEIEEAARVLGPVFFPRTDISTLMDVLENVNDMISGNEGRTPDRIAETFYNINPRDLREIVHKFHSVRKNWGVNSVAKGGEKKDKEDEPQDKAA